MILVMTDAHDTSARAVAATLRERGHAVTVFETGLHPFRSRLAIHADGTGTDVIFEAEDGTCRGSELSAVWYRGRGRLYFRSESPIASEAVRAFVEASQLQLLEALPVLLPPTTAWVYPLDAGRRAYRRLVNLQAAIAVGFAVPRTIATNDASHATAFVEQTGDVALKRLPAGIIRFQSSEQAHHERFVRIFTKRLDRAAGVEQAALFDNAPAILQEFVEKREEWRVLVVGERTFCASIAIDPEDQAQAIDYRRAVSSGALTPRERMLPADISDRCVALTRRLGLHYATIDLIRTPDDRIVFLELNPNGQWQWMQQAVTSDLGDAFADQILTLIGEAAGAARAACIARVHPV